VLTLLAPPGGPDPRSGEEVLMTEEESPAKRGDAAWKEQRDAVSRRNAQAQKRALADKQSKAAVVAATAREARGREADQLRDLNARMSKQGRRGR
jgi:hypothetical protein